MLLEKKDSKFFCIGEAKTTKDLFTKRTKDQIIDFLAIVGLNSGNKLVIGIPLNAKEDLQKLLIELGVIKQKQIQIIYIPEDLLPYEEEV